MASRTLSIPRGILPAMALIAQHHEKLSVLRAIIDALPPAKRTRRPISEQLAAKLGVSEQEAWQIVTQLMSFHQLRETFGMSAAEVFDAIIKSFEREAPKEWQDKNLELWKAARSTVEEIASGQHPLYLIQKALRLKYEHANTLRDSSLLVDARPIFDETGNTIMQWAVDFVLQVDYHDGSNRKQLYTALDIQDVRKLRVLCERAEAKSRALVATLDSTKRPVVITGAIDDECRTAARS
jgi:hypothetical protein